jgi:hypothetical protein
LMVKALEPAPLRRRSGRSAQRRITVLACAVMEKEILQFQQDGIEFDFLDYGLHRTPEKMAEALQTEIDRIGVGDCNAILIGYGLCSNGVVGLRAKNQPLILPRVHDCISLFLGSPESYHAQMAASPGTYYLTPGWIDRGETPLSKYESYAQRYDQKTARWVLEEEMKHYTRIVLIDTGAFPIDAYREIGKRNASFLGLSYEEMKGASTLFEKLVRGPWNGEFLVVNQGESVQQELFLDL